MREKLRIAQFFKETLPLPHCRRGFDLHHRQRLAHLGDAHGMNGPYYQVLYDPSDYLDRWEAGKP